MKIKVKCPKCKVDCINVLEKTLTLNKDILFQCPVCKMEIPVRLFKTKYNGSW